MQDFCFATVHYTLVQDCSYLIPDYSMLPYPTIPADSDCDEEPIAQDSATAVTEDLEVSKYMYELLHL